MQTGGTENGRDKVFFRLLKNFVDREGLKRLREIPRCLRGKA